MPENKIRILLVDDHAVVRAGYRLFLEGNEYIEIIAEAENGEKARKCYEELKPDVVVMDLSLPGISGIETAKRIISRHADAKILIFSMHTDTVFIDQALGAGARGYITKNSAPGVLIQAIIDVAHGNTYISNEIAQQLVFQKFRGKDSILSSLSTREFEIFCFLAQGLNTDEISKQLSLSQKTIANYSTQIKRKLKIGSLADMAKLAIQHNLIPL